MQVLVTSSRMPYAITEIRAFARQGHTVHAADTFARAPGNHSNATAETHETVSPRRDPIGYARQIGAIVDRYRIDLVVPTFEEAFYLMANVEHLGPAAGRVFAPGFDVIRRLHDKAQFCALADALGLQVPDTIVCRSKDELERATAAFEDFFARAVYSRAGTQVFTNTGPLAGRETIDEIDPTPDAPWLVQRFVPGGDLCSFSVCRFGKVVAHSTYRHPKTLDHSGGIVFESVEDPRTLDAASRIVESTDYHGQISLDFLELTDDTLSMVECNPRATSGVCVMPEAMFVDAVLGDYDGRLRPAVAPAGVRKVIRAALLRDIFVNPSEAWSDLTDIFSDVGDVYFEPGDNWPGVYQFLSLSHALRHWRSHGTRASDKLAGAYLHDLTWNGGDPSVGITDAAA
jgi:glutathione synthase/RimK-type ligase-like ATP-grasp enzyme